MKHRWRGGHRRREHGRGHAARQLADSHSCRRRAVCPGSNAPQVAGPTSTYDQPAPGRMTSTSSDVGVAVTGLPATGDALPVDVRVRAPPRTRRDGLLPPRLPDAGLVEPDRLLRGAAGPRGGITGSTTPATTSSTFESREGTTDEYEPRRSSDAGGAGALERQPGPVDRARAWLHRQDRPSDRRHWPPDGGRRGGLHDDTTRPLSGVAATGSFRTTGNAAASRPARRARPGTSLPVGKRRPRRLKLVPPPGATGCPAGGWGSATSTVMASSISPPQPFTKAT